MADPKDTRAAYDRMRGEMIKNGTPKKVADKKAREAAERYDRRAGRNR